ncbi:MAG: type IV secretion system DNA-binding domain-containing protein [Actinobacteria bacterium]|nr:type IV secretion system DNA-binding domain-containing protein [Actinomycetota bacterium]
MKRAALAWYDLRFPHDLDEAAVLAALSSLSGLAHPGRLLLTLRATEDGITHHVAVRPEATETVTAALRAAMPSLRVTRRDHQLEVSGQRWLWQFAPAVGALRSDELGPIATSLLSSLLPLGSGETIALTWTLKPSPHPLMPQSPDADHDGKGRALRAKLALPGFHATGELSISAHPAARRRRLMQRTGAVLRSLATPHGRLLSDTPWYGQAARLLGQRGRYFSVREVAAVIGWPIGGPDMPGLDLGAARRLAPHANLPHTGRVLGVSDYPGLARPVALSASASTKGLYVLGPTGTGKTSLLKNLIRDDLEQGRGMVVVETNGDLTADLIDLIPKHRVGDVILLDPTDDAYAVGFNPFASDADPSLIADQLSELFERLWASSWGPRTAQLTHMGLLTLARRPGSTLLDLPRLYLDPVFRAKVLKDLDDPVGLGPDWQWFQHLSEREQLTVVAPLLNKVRAFTARPAIRAVVGQPKPRLNLRRVIEEQKILLVHLSKGLLGAETAQLLGCLVLTATWQTFAERVRLAPSARHPFGLYVDEVQDFAAAPVPWDELFAQGRKYGAAVAVAHQNLTQLPKDLREVILANARSKVVFALSALDAEKLDKQFAPALTASDLTALDPFAVAALVALDNGGIGGPVTLTTPPPPQPLGSAAAVRRASRERYARLRSEVEASLRRAATMTPPPASAVGRRRRGGGA